MEDKKFVINEKTVEDNIKKQIKKLVLLKQMQSKSTYDKAVEDTVEFLISAVKELNKEEK